MIKQVWRATFYEDGRFSTSRFWKHVAYCAATYIILLQGVHLQWEMLALYLAVIAADNRAGAIIKARFKAMEGERSPWAGYSTPFARRRPVIGAEEGLEDDGRAKAP